MKMAGPPPMMPQAVTQRGHHRRRLGKRYPHGSALAFDGTGNQVQVPNTGFNPVGGQISFSLLVQVKRGR